MENVDPRLIETLKLDNDFWEKGDKPILAVTESGSIYTILSDGTITGGYLGDERSAKLHGAVYRLHGPIRAGKIVIGLSIEAITEDERLLATSPVESIYYLGDETC